MSAKSSRFEIGMHRLGMDPERPKDTQVLVDAILDRSGEVMADQQLSMEEIAEYQAVAAAFIQSFLDTKNPNPCVNFSLALLATCNDIRLVKFFTPIIMEMLLHLVELYNVTRKAEVN